MYSSPVQNTCSFMVPWQGQRPGGVGSSGSGPRCSQTSRVQGGCGCQLGALVPWGSAVPNQSQPLQPGQGVNRLTFLPLPVPLPGTQLNHYLGKRSPLLSAAAMAPVAA